MNLLQVTTPMTTTVADTLHAAPVAAAASEHTLSLLDLLLKGGIIMIPLGLLAILAVYIIIERWIYIAKISRINNRQIDNIKGLVLEGKVDTALSVCKSEDSSIFRILEIGIKRLGRPIREIESSIETASLIEVTRLSKKLGYLGIVAGIAPMLGFIGTIIGIIKIFYSISLADNISIGIIAAGLYEKMICSCSGLVVGVIAYAGYHYLNMVVDKFVSRAEIEVFSFLNLIQDPVNETEKK
jgi:biopolymer transport protein ExbB